MSLQVIKSRNGQPEYVLLPVSVYAKLRSEIEQALQETTEEYEVFELTDYVDNPVALARIQSHLTQQELAKIMGVTQAYVSKLEAQDKVTHKVLLKVKQAISNLGISQQK